MKIKTIDGIKNSRQKYKPKVQAKQVILVDSIFKTARPANRQPRGRTPVVVKVAPGYFYGFTKQVVRQRVPLMAAVAALFLAFGAGAWFVLNTSSSSAQSPAGGQVLGESTTQPSAQAADNTASGDALFNIPIKDLKQYLEDVNKPEVIAQRAKQIRQYLQEKNSPLAEAAQTIATQPHWDIIMAVAFAESSWGRNCNDNNCSNIGVKPGAPSWRHYSSYNAWAVDFNRLLDKRYKDWTLTQMCGVYVQPCNRNWLLATQQVLDELQAEHIE